LDSPFRKCSKLFLAGLCFCHLNPPKHRVHSIHRRCSLKRCTLLWRNTIRASNEACFLCVSKVIELPLSTSKHIRKRKKIPPHFEYYLNLEIRIILKLIVKGIHARLITLGGGMEETWGICCNYIISPYTLRAQRFAMPESPKSSRKTDFSVPKKGSCFEYGILSCK